MEERLRIAIYCAARYINRTLYVAKAQFIIPELVEFFTERDIAGKLVSTLSSNSSAKLYRHQCYK